VVDHSGGHPLWHHHRYPRAEATAPVFKASDAGAFSGKIQDRLQQHVKDQRDGAFFLRDTSRIPPYIVKTIFSNDIIYEDNILIYVRRKDLPFGVTGHFAQLLARHSSNFTNARLQSCMALSCGLEL